MKMLDLDAIVAVRQVKVDEGGVMDDAKRNRHRENAVENVRRGFGGVAYLPSSDTVDLIDAVEVLTLQVEAQRDRIASLEGSVDLVLGLLGGEAE